MSPHTKLYRTMMKDADGYPLCGPTATKLGAREFDPACPEKASDVRGVDGLVYRDGTGMSVAPDDPMNLRLHRRPVDLGGNCGLPLWVLEVGELGPDLEYIPDARKPRVHGVVGPTRTMNVEEYQRALCATRRRWRECR